MAASTPTAGPSARASASRNDWVRLNVGGTLFSTTRTTICRDPASFLARLCAEDQGLGAAKDESGAYLIDRDPRYFGPVLNYLRHGKIIIDKDLCEEGVLEEAEFYGIEALAAQLRQRQAKAAAGQTAMRHVYRVFESNEKELTEMMSTMSDGWRFEQLVSIPAPYAQDEHDVNQFIVVVSKDVPDIFSNP